MKMPSEKERLTIMEGVSAKGRILETALRTVTQGYCPALFVWGAPGLGKSHMISRILDGLIGATWKHHTAYSTPKGLMLTLAESPASIHVFEDCERMMRTDLSASILRAACGAPDGKDRWVTYETATERLRVKVTGGVVVVTNQNLARGDGPMQGVASRFRPIRWELSQQEVVAVIVGMAQAGWSRGADHLTPKECRQVADILVDMVGDDDLKLPLDLRMYAEHALPTFAYCKRVGSGDWQDVLRSKLYGTASTAAEGQAARTRRMEALALQIAAEKLTPKQRVQKWKELTGLGQAIYYRHLKAARSK